MQNVFLAAMNDGVAGVIPALAAHHDVGFGGKDIDDFPLAFIAPLRADQNRVRHDCFGQKFCPDALGRGIRDLRHRIRAAAARARPFWTRGTIMRYLQQIICAIRTILLIILVLLLLGALPTWPYSSGWGYYPGGGLLVLIILILVLWRA